MHVSGACSFTPIHCFLAHVSASHPVPELVPSAAPTRLSQGQRPGSLGRWVELLRVRQQRLATQSGTRAEQVHLHWSIAMCLAMCLAMCCNVQIEAVGPCLGMGTSPSVGLVALRPPAPGHLSQPAGRLRGSAPAFGSAEVLWGEGYGSAFANRSAHSDEADLAELAWLPSLADSSLLRFIYHTSVGSTGRQYVRRQPCS